MAGPCPPPRATTLGPPPSGAFPPVPLGSCCPPGRREGHRNAIPQPRRQHKPSVGDGGRSGPCGSLGFPVDVSVLDGRGEPPLLDEAGELGGEDDAAMASAGAA